jgi:2-methylcitrate dehydratase PrpD
MTIADAAPLARHLAAWLETLDGAPADVLADARMRLLDTLAVASAAVALPIGTAVRRAAAALGTGDAAALIGGGRSTAALAAMVNGTLAHALDFDDTHAASVMHPSAPAVAVALAMAEAASAPGDRLLLGIAAGAELNCRLGLVAPGAFHDAGQHPTGTLGTVSAAMIAAWFLGLDAAGIAAAAGIAGSQASGILEAYADGTWSKTLHPGWAAHAGIVAAHLAAAGFSGPHSVLEGRYGVFRAHLPGRGDFDFAALADDLGTRWHILDSAFKLYPCAHSIHAFIEAALAASVPAARIASVLLDIPADFASQIAEPRDAKLTPRTTTHARASVYYAVAAALVDGSVGMQHYTDAAIRRPDLLAMAARIEHRIVPGTQPIRFGGTLTIRTIDGHSRHHAIADAAGTGPRRLAPDAVEAKARTIGNPGEMDRIIALLRHPAMPRNVAALVPQ